MFFQFEQNSTLSFFRLSTRATAVLKAVMFNARAAAAAAGGKRPSYFARLAGDHLYFALNSESGDGGALKVEACPVPFLVRTAPCQCYADVFATSNHFQRPSRRTVAALRLLSASGYWHLK